MNAAVPPPTGTIAAIIETISEASAPAIYVAGGLDKFLAAATAEVAGEVPDLTTVKGRARIASLASQISKSKAAVEKHGRAYLKRLKESVKPIEAELRTFVDAMDALRDTTRQPLTEWEENELIRRDKFVDDVQAITDLGDDLADQTSAVLIARIATAEAIALGEHWEEFETDAARAKDAALGKLRPALVARQKFEAEQLELERLRAEKVLRDQQDNERRIADEATAAARKQADEDAAAERERNEQREQKLKEDASQAQRDTDAANQRAEQAELQRIEDAAKAERDRVAAAAKAKQDLIDAELQREQDIQDAAAAERKRADDAAALAEQQRKEREANIEHKSKIMTAAKEAFMAAEFTEDQARLIVRLIGGGKIPAVSIAF